MGVSSLLPAELISGRRVEVRALRDGDQPAIKDLFIRVNRLLAPPHLRQEFEAYITLSIRKEFDVLAEYYLTGRGHGFWVADAEGQIIGTFGLEYAGQCSVELRRMYVEPDWRGRGVGGRLIATAENVCRSRGASKLVLSTSELQTDAIRFYLAHGFSLVSECVAHTASNRTVGAGIRRFGFAKSISSAA